MNHGGSPALLASPTGIRGYLSGTSIRTAFSKPENQDVQLYPAGQTGKIQPHPAPNRIPMASMSVFFRSCAAPALALLAALALLSACSSDRYDPGLVRAPAFANDSGWLARPWQFAHHASTDSYTLTLADGAARIERVGHEPWSRLSQHIDRKSLPALAGRRMAFSMDIRAELDDSEYGRPIEPPGLVVRIWQETEGDHTLVSALVGSPRSQAERLALAADARIPEWQRHALEFELPETVSRLEISVVMSTGGTLEIRNPSLRVVEG